MYTKGMEKVLDMFLYLNNLLIFHITQVLNMVNKGQISVFLNVFAAHGLIIIKIN